MPSSKAVAMAVYDGDVTTQETNQKAEFGGSYALIQIK